MTSIDMVRFGAEIILTFGRAPDASAVVTLAVTEAAAVGYALMQAGLLGEECPSPLVEKISDTVMATLADGTVLMFAPEDAATLGRHLLTSATLGTDRAGL